MVQPSGADFAELIFPFAMTFDGYAVWGDFEILRDIAERVWSQYQRAGALPQCRADP